jgi:2-polyprenyl-3-methyl-5-hydroxy-6-metoxy-1,4-benzoquinol methylase
MSGTIHYQQCPVCGSSPLTPVFSCTDHLVSHQAFALVECPQCALRITQDVPDEDHIGPYYQSTQYVSHSDTDQGLVNKLYKTARRFTLAHKRRLVTALPGLTGNALLDVGCGTGAFLHTMAQAGWHVHGLEPDPGARAMALDQYGLQVCPADTFFNLKPQSYDIITLWHVLEHVHTLQEYMQHLRALLKPGGWLVVAVPNYTSADGRHYGKDWAAYDVPRHLYHFAPKSIRALAAKHGFTVAKQLPMWLDAYYIAMLSEQYRGGGGSLPKAVIRGMGFSLSTLGNRENCSSLIYLLK